MANRTAAGAPSASLAGERASLGIPGSLEGNGGFSARYGEGVWASHAPQHHRQFDCRDSLGYHGVARLIIEQQLGPQAIARLFSCSASHDRGRVSAMVLIAGSTARRHGHPEGWNGDDERSLARQALGTHSDKEWNKLAMEVVAIVSAHWGEIAGEA